MFGDSVPLLMVEQKMGEIKQLKREAINKYTLRMETQATTVPGIDAVTEKFVTIKIFLNCSLMEEGSRGGHTTSNYQR